MGERAGSVVETLERIKGLMKKEEAARKRSKLLGWAFPRTERALADLSRRGVGTLVNLHERPHDPRRL